MSNYLPLSVRKILSNTEWNDNEISVYSSLLEKGQMNISELSSETCIPVSTLQSVIKKLVSKQMISKNEVNNKPVYVVSDINQLRRWLKGYNKRFLEYQNSITAFVSQYDFNPNIETPKIRLFQGFRAVKRSYYNLLKDIRCSEVVNYYYLNYNTNTDLQKFLRQCFLPARERKNIQYKSIAVDTYFTKNVVSKYSNELSETKIIKSPINNLLMNCEISLYDDYMHCVNCDDNKLYSMIIKDKNMVEMQKNIYLTLFNTLS